MGGIGKTTLARAVYNDESLGLKIEKKAWFCVSGNFDVLRISKSLLESIVDSSSSPNDLNNVQEVLEKAIKGKKFLLVLDDVWDVDYNSWVDLKAPLVACARGSILIVTTLNTQVASILRSSDPYDLKNLSPEDCWKLFLKHASGTNADVPVDRIPDSIRETIVKRSGCLPLAAKTLGGLLGSYQMDTWEKKLNSEICDSTVASSILPVLKLSYHHLPSHLKRCFAYCAIFPKDYEFEEKELGLLWIAEGIVQQSENSKQLDVASKYFHHLLSRSFFQKSSNNSSKYVMHDLIHDLAELVFGEFGFRLEKVNELSDIYERTRHFSYVASQHDGKSKFEKLENFTSLRTFMPIFISDNADSISGYITNMLPFDLLPKLKKLRVLSLRNYCNIELLDSIVDLNMWDSLSVSNPVG